MSTIWTGRKPYEDFLSALSASKRPTRDLVGEVMGIAVGSSVNFAQGIAHVIDFYLDEQRAAERAEIQKLILRKDPEAKELLRGYVREAQREYLRSSMHT